MNRRSLWLFIGASTLLVSVATVVLVTMFSLQRSQPHLPDAAALTANANTIAVALTAIPTSTPMPPAVRVAIALPRKPSPPIMIAQVAQVEVDQPAEPAPPAEDSAVNLPNDAPAEADTLHIVADTVVGADAEAPPEEAPFTMSDSMAVLGFPLNTIIVMTPETRTHVHAIYLHGQQLGANPRAFSKVGDSTIQNPFFLALFEDNRYILGPYDYLQPVIDYYRGSFAREGAAVQRGLHSWSVFDPMWADPELCEPAETPLACEFRIHNPSVLLIRLGANDAGMADYFDEHMREIVEYAIANGVVPVLGTKADRIDGPENTNNNIIRQIAAEYHVPLWDFDMVAGQIPGRGLDLDQVHMTSYIPTDYNQQVAYERGHTVHNLTALMALDAVWRLTITNE